MLVMLINLRQNKSLIQMQSEHWHSPNDESSRGFCRFDSLLWLCGIAFGWQPPAEAMLRRLPH